jgi:hypothetical protein
MKLPSFLKSTLWDIFMLGALNSYEKCLWYNHNDDRSKYYILVFSKSFVVKKRFLCIVFYYTKWTR